MLKLTRVFLPCLSVLFAAFSYTPPMENQGRVPEPAAAAEILKAACGPAAQAGEGRMYCSPCPDFTSLHGLTTEQFKLRFVLNGDFTAPGSGDLAVFFEGCEPLADNFGGAVLLNRSGAGWKFARYDSGLWPVAVRSIRQSAGRDLLFSASNSIGMGLVNNSLDTFDFAQPAATARANVLLVSDTRRACGLEITTASLDKVTWQDHNFTAQVTWGKIKATPEYLKDCPDKIPDVATQQYQVRFVFDGTRFAPAEDSKTIFEQVRAR